MVIAAPVQYDWVIVRYWSGTCASVRKLVGNLVGFISNSVSNFVINFVSKLSDNAMSHFNSRQVLRSIINMVPGTAALLGLIQRRIGLMNQLFGIEFVTAVIGNADTGAQ